MQIQLLSAVTAANGPPLMANGSITTVAKANLVDGETFTLIDPAATYVFEFDVNGTGVTAGRVQVNVSTDTTAADVRDRIITAINASGIQIRGFEAGAATVGLISTVPGTGSNTTSAETVVDAGFAITDMAGGINGHALSNTTATRSTRGDRALLLVKSTAGSDAMSVTIRRWGYSAITQNWHPLGTGTASGKGLINDGNAIGESSTDNIAHTEILEGLSCLDQIYAEVTAIAGTSTAVSMWLLARD